MQLERLGPYKIGRRLGHGGMGAVYEGVDEQTGKPAAIKVLFPHLAAEAGFRERFEIEIETLRQLDHPNIVALHAWGEEDGQLYYVMELVRGVTLEQELERGRKFSWREVMRFGIDLCKALKHAHDRGVIHRDIKPANLLLTPGGAIKLSDFGIARLFGNTRLTMEGGLVGTAEYMSPEQAEGKPVTFHCDFYSLGGVLYCALAGRPPFQSRSLPELLNMHRLSQPPPLRPFCPDVPIEFEGMILRLLDKDPQQRAPNAGVLGRQLAAMEHGLTAMSRVENSPGTVTQKKPPSQSAPADDFTIATSPGATSEPMGATREFSTSGQPVAATMDSQADSFDLRPETPPPVSRFTTLEEAQEQQRAQREQERPPILLQTLALAGALALIGLLLAYVFWPPSADKLFGRIEKVAATGDADSLAEAEPDIKKFLSRFPDDERAPILRQYQETIDLERAEKRFQRKIGRTAHDETLGPIQRDYLEAEQVASQDPQRGAEQLQALIDLYGDEEDLDEAGRETISLARRRLEALQELNAESIPLRLKLIEAKLAQAAALKAKEPAAAAAICNDLVTLYGDKAWAAPAVAKARKMLAQAPAGKGG